MILFFLLPLLLGKTLVTPSFTSGSFTEQIKKGLPDQDNTSLIEKEQKQLLDLPQESFIQKNTLEPTEKKEFISDTQKTLLPSSQKEVIQLVQEGKDVPFEVYNDEKSSFFLSLRLPVLVNKRLSSSRQLQPFTTMYGSKYAADFNILFDYLFLKNRRIAGLGFYTGIGASIYKANGKFAIPVQLGSASVSNVSNVKFMFVMMPISFGLSARLFALKYVVPYVNAGPVFTLFTETRDDSMNRTCRFSLIDGACGHAKAFSTTVGFSFLMDWLFPKESAEKYSTNGIFHSYLSIEYALIRSFAGPLDYHFQGWYAGTHLEF